MIKGLEALEIIKNIELSHIEQSMVENYDDSYDCYYDEVDDGTIEEYYDEEIKTIEEALKELEQYKALETELGTTLKELCLFLKEGFSIEWNGKNVVAHAKKP